MKILRDGLVVSIVGQEGTAVARAISLLLIVGFLLLQKYLLKKNSINSVIKGNLIGFCAALILYKFIPNNQLGYGFLPEIFNKLLNQPSVLSFYVLSELFSVFIITNFWLLFNSFSRQENFSELVYRRLFSIGQVALICASMFCAYFRGLVVFSFPVALLCIVGAMFFLPGLSVAEEKPTEALHFRFSVFLVPLMTIIIGALFGLLDPYVKFQLQKIAVNQGEYIKYVAFAWIVQGIGCLCISELSIHQIFNRKIFAPLFGVIVIGIFLIFKIYAIGGIKFYGMFAGFIVVLLKIFKYAFFSPEKENFIKNHEDMHSIVFFDGLAGRVGKNTVAILLTIFFSLGYSWTTFEGPALFLIFLLNFFWLLLSRKI